MAFKAIKPSDLERILDRIANERASVATACADICDPSNFFRRLSMPGPEGDALRDSYARAREARADARFESIDAVLGNLHAGKIDAQVARVMIDTIKWQAGKERPARYGERTQVDNRFTDADGNDRELPGGKAALAAELDRIAERIAAGATPVPADRSGS